jgi:predicted RNA-binding Zn-ribbon protein involved in translation (DUF1610 family)
MNMECTSCGTDIPASFSHAIRKNECPACGQFIMDEEALALLGDLQNCIASVVRLRDEAVERIALAVIASYKMTAKTAPQPQPARSRPSQQKLAARRPAPARYEDEGEPVSEEELEQGIIPTADLVDPSNPISESERERIMEERVAMRYQMIPQERATTTPDALRARVAMSPGKVLSDSELADNPVLEQQRLLRLQKQETNMAAGSSLVRRSDE